MASKIPLPNFLKSKKTLSKEASIKCELAQKKQDAAISLYDAVIPALQMSQTKLRKEAYTLLKHKKPQEAKIIMRQIMLYDTRVKKVVELRMMAAQAKIMLASQQDPMPFYDALQATMEAMEAIDVVNAGQKIESFVTKIDERMNKLDEMDQLATELSDQFNSALGTNMQTDDELMAELEDELKKDHVDIDNMHIEEKLPPVPTNDPTYQALLNVQAPLAPAPQPSPPVETHTGNLL